MKIQGINFVGRVTDVKGLNVGYGYTSNVIRQSYSHTSDTGEKFIDTQTIVCLNVVVVAVVVGGGGVVGVGGGGGSVVVGGGSGVVVE